jgi:hypothetical protein
MKLEPNKQVISQAVETEMFFNIPVGPEGIASANVILSGGYTVTDAGISAGENVDGWLKEFSCEGKLNVDGMDYTLSLWDIRTNEFATFIAACEDAGRKSALFDGDPTTAERQYFFFAWEQNIDWTMFSKVTCKLVMQVGTTEWGQASALTCSFYLDLDEGGEPGLVEGWDRGYAAASTAELVNKHPDGEMVGQYWKLSAGYASTIRVQMNDKQDLFKESNSDRMIDMQGRLALNKEAAPSADLPNDGWLDLRAGPATNRAIRVTPSESAALLTFVKTQARR